MPTSSLVPIGVLAHLSGVPAETIRTWERRYNLLDPQRDARGRRLYTTKQLARLRLIAELNEHGERVADLAKLSDGQLKRRAQLHKENSEVLLPQQVRVAVLHPSLATRLAGPIPGLRTEVQVVRLSDEDPIPEGVGKVDVVLADLESLGRDPHSLLRRLRLALQPTSLMVTYRYMARPMREKLQTQPLRLLQGEMPADVMRERVVQCLLADRLRLGQRSRPNIPEPRRFTTAQLVELRDGASRLNCECVKHVSALVSGLLEFEIYSEECISASPADEALHRSLSAGTSRARAVMEELLITVLKAEGIQV